MKKDVLSDKETSSRKACWYYCVVYDCFWSGWFHWALCDVKCSEIPHTTPTDASRARRWMRPNHDAVSIVLYKDPQFKLFPGMPFSASILTSGAFGQGGQHPKYVWTIFNSVKIGQRADFARARVPPLAHGQAAQPLYLFSHLRLLLTWLTLQSDKRAHLMEEQHVCPTDSGCVRVCVCVWLLECPAGTAVTFVRARNGWI